MIFQTLKVAIIAAALSCCSTVMAQDCGCGNTGYIQAGNSNATQNNCGREISQRDAEGLWSNYCTENCGFDGGGCGCGGCKLGGRLRGMFAGGRSGGCGCDTGCNSGCNNGCFGYPTGGCGCGSGGMVAGGRHGCKLGGKLKGMFAGRGCGSADPCADPCAVEMTTSCGGGCGGNVCGGRRCKLGGKLKGMFSGGMFGGSRRACGTSGAYFGEAVGYEYGTAGIHSAVAGCATNACGCNSSQMMAAPMAQPTMQGRAIAAPAVDPAATSIVGEGQPANLELTEEPVIDSALEDIDMPENN